MMYSKIIYIGLLSAARAAQERSDAPKKITRGKAIRWIHIKPGARGTSLYHRGAAPAWVFKHPASSSGGFNQPAVQSGKPPVQSNHEEKVNQEGSGFEVEQKVDYKSKGLDITMKRLLNGESCLAPLFSEYYGHKLLELQDFDLVHTSTDKDEGVWDYNGVYTRHRIDKYDFCRYPITSQPYFYIHESGKFAIMQQNVPLGVFGPFIKPSEMDSWEPAGWGVHRVVIGMGGLPIEEELKLVTQVRHLLSFGFLGSDLGDKQEPAYMVKTLPEEYREPTGWYFRHGVPPPRESSSDESSSY